DRSTVECLAYLTQRSAPARLLVLGAHRPVEGLLQGHPLRGMVQGAWGGGGVLAQGHPLRGMVQERCGRGQGVSLRLEFLSAADVAAYVVGRLGGPVAPRLTALVYARTDGNALFMVTIVEHLVQQGVMVQRAGQWLPREEGAAQVTSLPAGLRGLLLRRIEALPLATQRVLEPASVVGETFTVA